MATVTTKTSEGCRKGLTGERFELLLILVFLKCCACSFSNCGCGYDGGDCCAKTVKDGKVKKDYWFVFLFLVLQYSQCEHTQLVPNDLSDLLWMKICAVCRVCANVARLMESIVTKPSAQINVVIVTHTTARTANVLTKTRNK